MKFMNLDSPVMRFLGRMGDLMLLNIITTICCLPIITVGAALTALHYESLKLVRGEEGYLFKDYFHSFKQNFKQATIIWLIMLALILIFVGDYYIVVNSGISFPQGMNTTLIAIAIVLFWVSQYIFPVLSHFDNTVFKTIKNGAFMSLMAAPKSLCMAIMAIAPIVGLYASARIIPIVLLFGISLPAYLSAMLYNGTFKKFEPEPEEVVSDEEFHVLMEDEDTPLEDREKEIEE